jgi:hypothetical protein
LVGLHVCAAEAEFGSRYASGDRRVKVPLGTTTTNVGDVTSIEVAVEPLTTV